MLQFPVSQTQNLGVILYFWSVSKIFFGSTIKIYTEFISCLSVKDQILSLLCWKSSGFPSQSKKGPCMKWPLSPLCLHCYCSPLLTLLQPHFAHYYFSHIPGALLPHGLCTCCFLFPECRGHIGAHFLGYVLFPEHIKNTHASEPFICSSLSLVMLFPQVPE